MSQGASHRLMLFFCFALLLDSPLTLQHVDERAAASQQPFGVSFGLHIGGDSAVGMAHPSSFILHAKVVAAGYGL